MKNITIHWLNCYIPRKKITFCTFQVWLLNYLHRLRKSFIFLQVRIYYGHYIHVTIYRHFSGTPTEVQNIFGGSIGLNKAWSRIPINFLSSNFCYKKIKIKEHSIVLHVVPIYIISQNCFRTVSNSNLFMCFKIHVLTYDFITKSSAYI